MVNQEHASEAPPQHIIIVGAEEMGFALDAAALCGIGHLVLVLEE